MSEFFKNRQIQLAIVGLSFLAVFVPYFIDVPVLTTFSTKLITIASIVNAFTITLALYSQFRRGYSFYSRRVRGYLFKVYMMATIILMIVFAVYSQTAGPYHWVMYSIITPLSSVNYSILAFYMASTGARAFRARNLRALMLLATGFIVLLYQAPITGAVFPEIVPPATYITETYVVAAARMFLISVTVGAIVFGMRVLMGKEVTLLGFAKERE